MVQQVGLRALDTSGSKDRVVWHQLARTEGGRKLLRTTKILKITNIVQDNEIRAVELAQALAIGASPEQLSITNLDKPDSLIPVTDLTGFDGRRLRELEISGLHLREGWEQILFASQATLTALSIKQPLHKRPYQRPSWEPPLQLPIMQKLQTVILQRGIYETNLELERALCAAAVSIKYLKFHGYNARNEATLLPLASPALKVLTVDYCPSNLCVLAPCLRGLTIGHTPKRTPSLPSSLEELRAPLKTEDYWSTCIASGALPNLRAFAALSVNLDKTVLTEMHRNALLKLRRISKEKKIVLMDRNCRYIRLAWLQTVTMKESP